MPTLTCYPVAGANSPVDGYVRRDSVNETFATIGAGAGNSANVTSFGASVSLVSTTTSNQFSSLSRAIFCFDTSSIPIGSTITNATLSFHGSGSVNANGLGSPDLHIASATPASTSNLVTADYGQTGSTSFGSISYASFIPANYNTITLNSSGLANINMGGVSAFSAKLSWDLLGSFTGTWASNQESFIALDASEQGTNYQPTLVVGYTLNPPTVTTQAVTNNTALTTATGNGNVTDAGSDTITERGTVLNTAGTPTTADTKFTSAGTTGAFTTSMTGLIPGTLYHVRAYATNSVGTSYGSEVTFTAVNFLNPTYAYADDANYCTAGADSGIINIQLSGDAGVTWSSTLSQTYTSSETELTFGNGATELWGNSWLGSNVSDTNFRLRVSCGTRADTHKWQTFGFAPGSSVILTGISIKVKAKWTTPTMSIGHISAEILYGSSTIPVTAGSVAYGSDASTTGALEVYNGSAWKELVDTSTAQALTNKTTATQSPADNSTNLATTAYVDNAVLGQNFKEAVGAATTANLVGVYLNGSSGVGATFTYTATGVDVIDGVTLTLGMRVLVKNQTTAFQNGIYTVTTAGALAVAGILTRATDGNQTTDWKTGDSTFVTAGTAQSTTTWAYTGIDLPTMGTTSLTFAQTAGQGSFTAGNGIAITGNSIAIATSPTLTTPNIGAATGTSLSVSGQLTSTVATGTAPLAVTSTTKVTNLNADMVDGIYASATPVANQLLALNSSSKIPVINTGFSSLNIKSSINATTMALTNTDQDLASIGLPGLSFTVTSACMAWVSVSLGVSSTSDYEFMPKIRVDGTIVATYSPSAASASASRATVRGFTYGISLTAGVHVISAGVFLYSATSPSISASGATISAFVLGDVTA